MIDANTKEYKEDNGKVTGVKLEIAAVPNSLYYVETLTLIDEKTALGKTVCTFFVEGQKHKCWLGYPFANDGNFQNKLAVGGGNNEHVIVNGFDPKRDIGPLCIYVGDEKGNCISDIVRGLGLPNKHHISFVVGFKKRESITQPPSTDLESRVLKLEKQIQSILKAFVQMQGDF